MVHSWLSFNCPGGHDAVRQPSLVTRVSCPISDDDGGRIALCPISSSTTTPTASLSPTIPLTVRKRALPRAQADDVIWTPLQTPPAHTRTEGVTVLLGRTPAAYGSSLPTEGRTTSAGNYPQPLIDGARVSNEMVGGRVLGNGLVGPTIWVRTRPPRSICHIVPLVSLGMW